MEPDSISSRFLIYHRKHSFNVLELIAAVRSADSPSPLWQAPCALVPGPSPDKRRWLATARECCCKIICHFTMKFSARHLRKVRAPPRSDARRTDFIDASKVPGPQWSGSLQISSSNVLTLTRKSLEVTEALNRRKVNICCLQGTYWSGDKATNLANGFRL